MAESIGSSASGHPSLNLNAEEKRVYGQLLKDADPDGFGAVSGDVAVKFFERTKLPADVLGQIWQIADTENRGFLTPAGFGVALRLIGHAQAGRAPSAQLAPQSAPLPRFDNAANEQPQPAPLPPQPIPQQSTGTPASPTPAVHPIRVPALGPDKVAEYSSLFEKSGAENGFLSGVIAKQIFERARLPNDVLGRIWALSDTQGQGTLDVTEFVIAMHLLTSYKSGQMRGVPNTLPSGLYEAASRRTPVRMGSGSRPGSSAMQGVPPQIPAFNARPQSPITRQQVSTPLSAQSTGEVWAITPTDKARFDTIFASIDRQGSGYINGEQAVEFFGNARLPEEILAQIWDLADVNSEGRLNKDEFAVAMYLIRQQRATKDGRGNLPQTLPPALIPPSMRKQQAPPPQPTAPSFENAPVTKPRSAADDLFGLDAFGPAPTAPATAPPQVAQSTGGTDAGPFANPPSFAAGLSPQHTSTTFKPFIPSSSFGQSIIPQSTGSPAPQAKSPPMSNDDLLGDADPEVSSKLTSETSELGNLSNQVSTLSKQMTEVQGTRKQTEQELSTTTAQKRAFEGRLAQLRSLYEKEVQEVKVLREQLTANKTEIKRLQQDMAMIDGTHQDLSTQHQQLRAQLESDQRENLALKERIRQTNQEVDQLKPQLDKLKSEARQTKGLVAINKKQLATNETERDRIKAEIAAAQKEVEDAQREAEESARQVEASKKELEEARSVPVPTVKSPTSVASPAPSTSSNPFFRRTTETSFSPPIAEEQPKDNTQNAFDSIFGPSFGAAAAPAPAVSFSSSSPPPDSTITQPNETAESTPYREPEEAPSPPQSRQLTSAALPFRRQLEREDSVSSSVKVAPPTSRLSPAETPRALTPTTSTSSPSGIPESHDDPFTAAAPDAEQESVRQTLPQPSSSDSAENAFGKPSSGLVGIPGAFPSTSRSDTPAEGVSSHDATPGAGLAAAALGTGAAVTTAAAVAASSSGDDTAAAEANKGDAPKSPEQGFDDYFGGPAHARTASQKAADFDSAFANMQQPPAANGAADSAGKEFPDIEELGQDDDSSDYSDETPMKFEDDFTAKSPPKDAASSGDIKAGKQPEIAPGEDALRPPLQGAASTSSSLPSPDQQKSPPTYGDVVPHDDPSHFPPEFKGLLPERQDPTLSPPTEGGASNPGPLPSGEPPAYGPEAHPRSPSDSKASAPPPTVAAPFDFDSAFSGVGAAPVEDDNDEDEDAGSFIASKTAADFDPTFDSPPQSRSSALPQTSTYDSVTTNGASQGGVHNFSLSNGSSGGPETGPNAGGSHDWDALFAPLNTNTAFPSTEPAGQEPALPAERPAEATPVSPAAPAPASLAAPMSKPERPQPGRALSTGTEHDDPILKRLTAMGWSREESLAALEKFDYNIDKAADFLTFRS